MAVRSSRSVTHSNVEVGHWEDTPLCALALRSAHVAPMAENGAPVHGIAPPKMVDDGLGTTLDVETWGMACEVAIGAVVAMTMDGCKTALAELEEVAALHGSMGSMMASMMASMEGDGKD